MRHNVVQEIININPPPPPPKKKNNNNNNNNNFGGKVSKMNLSKSCLK